MRGNVGSHPSHSSPTLHIRCLYNTAKEDDHLRKGLNLYTRYLREVLLCLNQYALANNYKGLQKTFFQHPVPVGHLSDPFWDWRLDHLTSHRQLSSPQPSARVFCYTTSDSSDRASDVIISNNVFVCHGIRASLFRH